MCSPAARHIAPRCIYWKSLIAKASSSQLLNPIYAIAKPFKSPINSDCLIFLFTVTTHTHTHIMLLYFQFAREIYCSQSSASTRTWWSPPLPCTMLYHIHTFMFIYRTHHTEQPRREQHPKQSILFAELDDYADDWANPIWLWLSHIQQSASMMLYSPHILWTRIAGCKQRKLLWVSRAIIRRRKKILYAGSAERYSFACLLP